MTSISNQESGASIRSKLAAAGATFSDGATGASVRAAINVLLTAASINAIAAGDTMASARTKINTLLGAPAPSFTADFTAGTIPSGVAVASGSNGLTRDNTGKLVGQTTGIDYGAAGNSPALSVRPDATNLLAQSRNLANSAAWALAGHAASGASDPTKVPTLGTPQAGFDGASSVAQRVTFQAVTNAGAGGELSAIQQYVTGLTVGQRYTASVIMKAPSGSPIAPFTVQGGAGISYALIAKIEPTLTTSYVRYQFSFVATTTDIYLSVGVSNQTTSSFAGFTADIDNIQLEAGPIATNNIFTGASALSRSGYDVTLTIPAGVTRLKITFDDGTFQWLACAASSTFTLPKMLNKTSARITRIDGRAANSNPVTSVSFGTPYRYNQSYPTRSMGGDTPAPTWGSDDQSYTALDDTEATDFDGAGSTGGTSNYNNMIARFANIQTPSAAVGRSVFKAGSTTVNALDQLGSSTQGGSDSTYTSWKAGSTIAIGDALYMSISRNTYGAWLGGDHGYGYRQHASGGQIIKSTDFGQTWTPLPATRGDPLASPMFTGSKAGTLVFVQGGNRAYRNEYAAGMDQYVYGHMFSFWNDGDDAYAGRCLITNIGNLDASQWEWRQADGSWAAGNSGLNTAVSIYHNTGKVGQFGVFFDPNTDRFVGLPWWYQSYIDNGTVIYSPSTANDTTWDVLEGPTPWQLAPVSGASKRWNTAQGTPGRGLYFGAIIPQTLGTGSPMVICAGDFGDPAISNGAYTPTWVPFTLGTT